MAGDVIAIVGMACRYPDARGVHELWENVLAQRRAFRRMPAERLRIEDYFSADRTTPDSMYAAQAAVIADYAFDRVRYRVAGSTYRQADLAHWLALDIAAQALADARFEDGAGLPRETTGVVLGNTLTGEFSRANTLRLRWPYVRRVVDAALGAQGWEAGRRRDFLAALERDYKAPFPEVGEETLAGGLSNTIAGRICNYFDLKGGGYTVDGACAASLLAVTTACSALAAGDLDVAIAGGVDLSLDPFELVGFAKTGALAEDEMRVYDARSNGFWPGEGCGFVVLMRYDEALAEGRRIYALVRGWGVASDGSGGITRPEVEGQLFALRRAYRRAGFGADTVACFEGHGTGTAVGDGVELQVIARARREGQGTPPPAVIGSIKANIGHTKAAAGVAGLIKATLALHTQVLPPATGCGEPHPVLAAEAASLQALAKGELWPADRPLRAAVSAMGFGGINTHVVLEGIAHERRRALEPRERALLATPQDAELMLFAAAAPEALVAEIERVLGFAARLSRAELADLAHALERRLIPAPLRAAVVAGRPDELERGLRTLRAWLLDGVTAKLDPRQGLFLGRNEQPARIGYLFPGQGSPSHVSGGALRRRFECACEVFEWAALPASDSRSTDVAQPAIVANSIAALRVLGRLGIEAEVALGHSLGELTAYHWAGACDERALLRIAAARGRAMADLGSPTGAMASLGLAPEQVESLIAGTGVVIAGLNAPRQTVVSGERDAVAALAAKVRAQGASAVEMQVSHAFHSPLVKAAAPALAGHLRRETLRPLARRVASTVTGGTLPPSADLGATLISQVTSPVRFTAALAAAGEVDLWLEVGPGRVLGGLAAESVRAPFVSLDAGGSSLVGILHAAGAAWALGARLDHAALFDDRVTRPFDLDWHPTFFANPCESAPLPGDADGAIEGAGAPGDAAAAAGGAGRTSTGANTGDETAPAAARGVGPGGMTTLELVRALVAERVELPASALEPGQRLLGDLHLNSIVVGQLASEAARVLGLPTLTDPTHYAGATLGELADALEQLCSTAGSVPAATGPEPPAAGVDNWVRAFEVRMIERPRPRRPAPPPGGGWRVLGSAGHPLAPALEQAFAAAGAGGGVVVCLPEEPDERQVALLLEGARELMALPPAERRLVMVQQEGGGGAFARSVHLELRPVATCVVDIPFGAPQAAAWIVAEALAATGYAEAHYDSAGVRRERALAPIETRAPGALPLGADDVLLVTGGGKGIAAECALALARESGTRVALLGRSRPESDAELAGNLRRFEAAGVRFRYLSADVTDEAAVREAVARAVAELGPITAIIHGAGINQPRPLSALDEAAFQRTLAPKLAGARHVLAAVDPDRLRLFVAFGSIIARTGLRGEADYAVANEWLARLGERVHARLPRVRVLTLEWSLWSGGGMGERLGRMDALAREGIVAIPPAAGIAMLRDLLTAPPRATSVVVTGRFGDPPTLAMAESSLPLRRFLERPRVVVPGVELVVDAEISAESDPYLDDHVFAGSRLLPAVIGLEAMAEAAMALAHSETPPVFEDVRFLRPVLAPESAPLTLRLAALRREDGVVDVVLRSGETSFQAEHFTARCSFGGGAAEAAGALAARAIESEEAPSSVALDPGRDLYGRVLFQRGRFQRVRAYRSLSARECEAEIAGDGVTPWFGPYLPASLVLGDPGVRDAAIHAIQACIPHVTLIPVSVERIVPEALDASGPFTLRARERSQDGDLYVYDLELADAAGRVRERWEGLTLKAVARVRHEGAWAPALLANHAARRAEDLIPGAEFRLALIPNGAGADAEATSRERTADSDRAIAQALGRVATIRRRGDGRPQLVGDETAISVAHAGALTLAVAGRGPLGCDAEAIVERPLDAWRRLLGPERFALAERVAAEAGEAFDVAATRVWTALECVKKAGLGIGAPLVLEATAADGWVSFSAGASRIASLVAQVGGPARPLALAVLATAAARRTGATHARV